VLNFYFSSISPQQYRWLKTILRAAGDQNLAAARAREAFERGLQDRSSTQLDARRWQRPEGSFKVVRKDDGLQRLVDALFLWHFVFCDAAQWPILCLRASGTVQSG
jgi:hypothetical protein